MTDTLEDLFRSRWRGQPGRLEVWYTTITDPGTGTGVWFHHELVSPTDSTPAHVHGWAAVFPPGEQPSLARFGPHPWTPAGSGFTCDGVEVTTTGLRGRAGEVSWDLRPTGTGARPLYTFPRWAWERDLLPAAQVVPQPAETFSGTLRLGGRPLELTAAPGATARIYGHGNARRWAWLHADLGGGDVCEVVAAVPNRPLLDRVRPLPFVRLRVAGDDWPGAGLLAAMSLRATVGLPTWTVQGRLGGRALRVEVTLPPAETLAVDYRDPDGTRWCATTANGPSPTSPSRVARAGTGGPSAGGAWTGRHMRRSGCADGPRRSGHTRQPRVSHRRVRLLLRRPDGQQGDVGPRIRPSARP